MDLSLWSFWPGMFAAIAVGAIHCPFEVFSMWRLHILVRILAAIALIACTYTVVNGVYWVFNYDYEEARLYAQNKSIDSLEGLYAILLWPYWPYVVTLYGVLMSLLYIQYISDPKGTSDKLEKQKG